MESRSATLSNEEEPDRVETLREGTRARARTPSSQLESAVAD
jgi:hypothetical protein